MSQGNDQRIHQAAMEGNLEILIKCVEEGENINSVGCDGNTLLHYAAAEGHNAVVKYLIKHVTSVDTPNIHGDTPILMAVYSKQVDTFDLLIGAGANSNWQDGIGRTLLHHVCHLGWTRFAKTLIDRGVEKNAQDHDEETPLMAACRENHLDTIEFLLAAGVDKDKTENYGWTPLHISCKSGHTSIVQLLLAHGADPNMQTHRGESALHLACITGNKDIVSMLLVNGADIHIRDDEGATPLHTAISRGFCFLLYAQIIEIVEKLLCSGADPAAKDNNGNTPYGICLAKINKYHAWSGPQFLISTMVPHLIKLKLADLPVTTDGIAALDVEAYGHFQFECLQELEKAKKFKVYEHFTIGNVFLKHDEPYYCANSELLETLEEKMNSPLFLEEYPIYGYVFRSVLKSSKIRYRLLDCALESLKSDTRIKFVRELDDLVKQQILAYLNNDHLKSLIESV